MCLAQQARRGGGLGQLQLPSFPPPPPPPPPPPGGGGAGAAAAALLAPPPPLAKALPAKRNVLFT